MDIFSMVLSLLSGVALFLFGMQLMGDGLKMVAGDKLESFSLQNDQHISERSSTWSRSDISHPVVISDDGLWQSDFVNSGMMKLRQAIGIIMGANIGTSITGWILCLSYIEGSNGIASILSSATIAAVVAVIGIILRMASKRTVHRNIGDHHGLDFA